MFYFPPVGDIHLEISLSKLVFHAESTGKTLSSIARTVQESELKNEKTILRGEINIRINQKLAKRVAITLIESCQLLVI